MTPFLEAIATHFVRNHGRELAYYRFIFPNKRSGKFFSHYLQAAAKDQIILSPEITTLSQLVERSYHYTSADPVILTLELYKIYHSLVEEKEGKEFDFNAFYPIGEMILNDFSDIDRQMVDAKQLFTNTHDLESIHTNPQEILDEHQWEQLRKYFNLEAYREASGGKGADPHHRFLSLWDILHDLYIQFRKTLQQQHLCYPGMELRQLASDEEKLEQIALSRRNVIIGFYTLTQSEKQIFKRLQREGAIFYRDIPQKYKAEITDADELDQLFPMPQGDDGISFDEGKEQTKFELYSFPSGIAQATYLSHAIRQVPKDEITHLRTAIVLPTERLLVPLRSSLPNDIPQINVTMGYPVRDTQIVGMLELLQQILLSQDLDSRSRQSSDERRWRASDVLALVNQRIFDPVFKSVDEKGSFDVRGRLAHLFSRDKIYACHTSVLTDYLRQAFANEEIPTVLSLLFGVKTGSSGIEVLRTVREILLQLQEYFACSGNSLQQDDSPSDIVIDLTLHEAVIPHLLISIDDILGTLSREHRQSLLSTSVAHNILRTILRNTRIPFSGEPLRGLQVMGILEARCLDFDTIFIPDASEGLLPQKRKVIGLIPFVLRLAFDLPTYRWQDQIRSYNFFRLIQRARRVVFLYDSRKSAVSTGERSRYISILDYLYGVEFSAESLSYPLAPYQGSSSNEIDLSLLKDFRDNLLSPHGLKALSPSAMKSYLLCPRQFYYRYVMGISDKEEFDDLMQENTLGTIVHRTLEILLKRFEKKFLDKTVIAQWLQERDTEVEAVLQQVFRKEKIKATGYNLVQYRVAKQMVCHTLQKEADKPITLLYLGAEYPLRMQYPLEGLRINLKGFIDRVDCLPGKYIRIVDYKTGSDSPEFQITHFKVGATSLNAAAFQILSYCQMLKVHGIPWHDEAGTTNLCPSLSRTREEAGSDALLYTDSTTKRHELQLYEEVAQEFGPIFEQTLLAIARDDGTFPTFPNRFTTCKYCPASSVCTMDPTPTPQSDE